MFGNKRAAELQEAKRRYDEACSRHNQLVEQNMTGQVSATELLDARDEMLQAKIDFQEISYGDEHFGA